MNPRACRGRAERRGSVLIAVLLFTAFVAGVLTTYLRLAATALNHANRTFYDDACAELAECGVEEAMAAFYDNSLGNSLDHAWHDWSRDGTSATRTFTGFSPGPHAGGVVRVWVQNYAGTGTPLIVAKATLTLPSGPPIEKYIEVTGKFRGLFSRCIVAQDKIDWSGSASVDSWNSDPDNDPATPAVPYSAGVARANGSVASMARHNGDVNIGSAHIYGTVATGGGTIGATSSAVVSGSFTGTGIDPSRVTRDFSATFPAVTAPVPTVVNTLTTNPLPGTAYPRTGDLQAPDGRYYYLFAAGTGIILGSGSNLVINASCVFIFNNHENVPCFLSTGGASIEISPGATFVMYTNGNISTSGHAFINRNGQPAAALVYGTNPHRGHQSVTISGVGGAGAAFYMPNADLTVTGSVALNGAFVGNKITMSGSSPIHYDEALARVGSGVGILVTKWKQLNSTAERAVYAAQLGF